METKSPETLSTLTEALETLAYVQPLASKGKRFANLLIDDLIIYVVCAVVAVNFFFPSVAATYRNPEQEANASVAFLWHFVLIWYIVKFLYYLIFERFAKGRTLGKLCTRTRAVIYEDRSELTDSKVFVRTLCRLIPFEIFSGFGIPWHDSITRTTVVSEKSSK
jgi:uncharacterized RDD family membrane protein YckC